MPYIKGVWVDDVSPLSAARLNNLETQYDEVKAELAEAGTSDIKVDARNVQNSGGSSVVMNNVKAYGNVSYTDSIAAGSTLTKTIALGSSYKHGKAVIRSGGSYGHGLIVFFGTDNLKTLAVGNANASSTQNYGSAWSRRAAGKVSNKYDAENAYTYGIGVAGSSLLGVDEVYINGTNLTIIFRNYDTNALNLNCIVDWEVW